jgi:transcriptional regulator with XRE-family HTH domain
MKKQRPIQPPDTKAREREIAARLRRARQKLKLKNREIAGALGVGEPTIKKIMEGDAVAQFAKLALLCEVLETTPNEVLGFSGFDLFRLQEVLEALLVEIKRERR